MNMPKQRHKENIVVCVLISASIFGGLQYHRIKDEAKYPVVKVVQSRREFYRNHSNNAKSTFESNWNSTQSNSRANSPDGDNWATRKYHDNEGVQARIDAATTASMFESKWHSYKSGSGSGQFNSSHGSDYEKWASNCCGSYINTHSGCKIARWYYSIGEEVVNPFNRKIDFRDCDEMQEDRNLTHASLMKENDTVYVTFVALEQFVTRMLGQISVNFVLISGQSHLVPPFEDEDIFKTILDHNHVIQWFCQNLKGNAGIDKRHPKLHPFPYGMQGGKNGRAHKTPMYYKEAMEKSMDKTNFIYAGPLSNTNTGRKQITQEGKRVSLAEYYAKVAAARYLISPDGDRPDCYRHYEAIFLGTVPITQLDSFLYRHLAGAPVVFNNKDWNLTSLATKLDPHPKLNRNLILEEYWMDWVDHVVGMDLNWSDDLAISSVGFKDDPYESWAPISDAFNDWVSVSDSNVCCVMSHLGPSNPTWGLEGNASITKHIACCSNISSASVPIDNVDDESNGHGYKSNRQNYKLTWFDRESGWKGTTYTDAESFCSAADMYMCHYAAYCPEAKCSSPLSVG